MKKLLTSILVWMFVLAMGMTSVVAEEFVIRNGINMHATMAMVEAMETLPAQGRNTGVNPPWTAFKGTIMGIADTVVAYWFDKATGEICDVKFTFSDAGIKDMKMLNTYYEKVYSQAVAMFGEASNRVGGVTGKAHADYADTASVFSMIGGKFTIVNEKEWLLEYDGYAVKVDLLAYTMKGSVGSTFTLSMGYRRIARATKPAVTPSITLDNETAAAIVDEMIAMGLNPRAYAERGPEEFRVIAEEYGFGVELALALYHYLTADSAPAVTPVSTPAPGAIDPTEAQEYLEGMIDMGMDPEEAAREGFDKFMTLCNMFGLDTAKGEALMAYVLGAAAPAEKPQETKPNEEKPQTVTIREEKPSFSYPGTAATPAPTEAPIIYGRAEDGTPLIAEPMEEALAEAYIDFLTMMELDVNALVADGLEAFMAAVTSMGLTDEDAAGLYAFLGGSASAETE